MENVENESVESISALCSVEHFGLGRFGDKIEPDAWEKALKAFQRVLKKGGRLYFSVHVGQTSKVCFNAHRVFRPELIIDTLASMDIVEFSYIDGFGTTICMERKNGALQVYKDKLDSIPEFKNNGNTGLFEFVKR